MQGLLTRSELIVEEENEEDWAMPGDQSLEMGNKTNEMDDILNADTSLWDPFRDA